MAAVLKVDSLVKDYRKIIGRGKTRVLKGISFEVNEGDLFGLIGPNGAGKTTLIKILINLIFPTSGSVEVLGLPAGDVATRKKVGYVSEVANFYPYLSANETLFFYGRLSGLPIKFLKERIREVLELVQLSKFSKVQLKFFSKGMLQRLNLAQSLLHDPPFLIYDEPVSGLDPLARIEIRGVLKQLHDQKKTIFFSSHELSEVETLCTHVGLLKEGELKQVGKLDELLQLKQDETKESLEQFFVRIMLGESSA